MNPKMHIIDPESETSPIVVDYDIEWDEAERVTELLKLMGDPNPKHNKGKVYTYRHFWQKLVNADFA